MYLAVVGYLLAVVGDLLAVVGFLSVASDGMRCVHDSDEAKTAQRELSMTVSIRPPR